MRIIYYDFINKRWEKDASLLDNSSGNEVEIGSVAGVDANDNVIDENGSINNNESGGEGNETWDNMCNKVWDDRCTDDVDRDFVENIQNLPFVLDQSDGDDLEITMQKSIIPSIGIAIVMVFLSWLFVQNVTHFTL